MIACRVSRPPLWILLLTLFSGGAYAVAENQDPAAPASANKSSDQKELALSAFEATYQATIDKGVSLDGSATISLRPQNNGAWLYQFEVNSFIADINESLLFNWEDNHVVPTRYRYKLSGMLIPKREKSLDFDWVNNKVSGSFRGKSVSLPLESGILDPLGFQIQMAQDIRAGKTDVTYKVANRKGYDTDRFAVIGEETIGTELGALSTVKVEKVRGEGKARETLMWFAPELNYLLVRLVQREPDGTRYEIHINTADVN